MKSMKFLFTKKKSQLPKVLTQPEMPSNIGLNGKWLSGEGAGSWFVFEKKENRAVEITRFSPKGNFECKENFNLPSSFIITKNFSVTYPSNCSLVTVKQDEVTITLTKI